MVGWLLWDKEFPAATVATIFVVSALATAEWVLLLGGGVNAAGGLLANCHAVLLEVRELALDWC
jgi:hypothetical protein